MKMFLICSFVFLCLSTNGRAEVCFIVKEKDKILKSEGNCQIAYAPNSTFKIALSLMGFDAGILKSELDPSFPYKSEFSTPINVCKGDHNAKTWMRDSCVWFSQVLTTKLGAEKFRNYVMSFEYGNKDISGGLTKSWLNSSIKITPEKQLQFIQRMIDHKLPVSSTAIDKTKNILFVQELPGGWNLYGKTGNGRYKDDLQHGWFVGWIEKNNRRITFTNHIADTTKQSTYASFRSKNEALIKLWYLIDELEK